MLVNKASTTRRATKNFVECKLELDMHILKLVLFALNAIAICNDAKRKTL